MMLDFLNRSFDALLDLIEYEKQFGRKRYLVSRECIIVFGIFSRSSKRSLPHCVDRSAGNAPGE
jgi:hypothetical protein